jgi:PiT family inorganic phosphate transporter
MENLYWMAVATVVIVLFFDYTNGFHDAANIVATIIASRAMTPAQAVVVVGVFEFLGPLLGVRRWPTPSASSSTCRLWMPASRY